MNRCEWCHRPGFGAYCTPDCAAAQVLIDCVGRNYFPPDFDPADGLTEHSEVCPIHD